MTTYYRYSVNGGPWSDWLEYSEAGNFTFDDNPQGVYRFEYYSTDQLGNTEPTHSETDLFDKEPPRGWVLNPTSGRWYHDGETFSVYAPAYDAGEPASGFASCAFSAIDIHFEELSGSELAQVMALMGSSHDMDELLAFLGPSRYTLVGLGQVPYSDGVCRGTATIPQHSGLTDKAYLVIKITDRSCNAYYDFARPGMDSGETILMDIDNNPPFVELTGTQGLDSPTTTGRQFGASLEITELDSGLDSCRGVIENGEGASYSFGIPKTGFSTCAFSMDVPAGLQDGSHTIWLIALDDQGNSGNASATIMIDNTPPSKAVTLPVENQTYGQIVPIELVAADNTGVNLSTVQYRIFEDLATLFGTPIGSATYDSDWRTLPRTFGNASSGSYGVQFNTTLEGLQDGKTYYLRARACDLLFTGVLPQGAEIPPHCTDPELPFKVDLRPPAMGGVTVSGGSLSWPAASDATGVDYYNVYLDGVFVASTASTSYDTGGEEGNWSVSAVDNVGNEGQRIGAQPPGYVPPVVQQSGSSSSGSNGGSYGGSTGGALVDTKPAKQEAKPQASNVQDGVVAAAQTVWKAVFGANDAASEPQALPAAPSQPAGVQQPSGLTGLVAGGMFNPAYGVYFLTLIGACALAYMLFFARRGKGGSNSVKSRDRRL
ncbi:MAG: hypothetical protein V1787_00925 [Candidatus Micrarchaeota archaeon]